MEGLEKLKEEIARRFCEAKFLGGSITLDTAGEAIRRNCYGDADFILILFQDWLEKEIGELEVIGDEKIRECHFSLAWHPSVDISVAKLVAQAQLDSVKKHFGGMK